MNRREKLILNSMQDVNSESEAKFLEATVKIVLGDMGEQYRRFWKARGAGVLFFSPEDKRNVFYKTLGELYQAQEACERDNDGDLAESFRRILKAAEKINPEEKAGYVLLDDEGMRYIEIDYQKKLDGDS